MVSCIECYRILSASMLEMPIPSDSGVLAMQQGLCPYGAIVLYSNKENALPLRMTISPDLLKTRRLLSGECQIVVVI